jgi:hypothetical protein
VAKKNSKALPYPADLTRHAAEAHALFHTRIKQAIARAEAAAVREDTPDLSDIAARRRSTLRSGEAKGIAEAVRRYGGPKSGLLNLSEEGYESFLTEVRAVLEANIGAKSRRVAKLTLEYFKQTPDSDKQRDVRSTLLVTVGWLEGYKRVLDVFDSCFHQLHVRLVLA